VELNRPLVEIGAIAKTFVPSNLIESALRRPAARPVEVLSDVNLVIQRGEFVALLGANGAGKTTILKTVATLLHTDAGHVRVLGLDTRTDERRVREVVGYVMADERSFHWRLSAEQNLDFFARLDGIDRQEREARIRYLLERLDLASASNRPFGQFSTGMKQRLAVARALIKRPIVLLMDEPTRSIDPAHAAEVWRLVREEVEAASGCLILVTHQIQEALSLCNRVAILADGKIVLDTTAESLARYAGDLDGFTVSVRGLGAPNLERLKMFQGIRDVRVASQVAGEQLLEVLTMKGDGPMPGFLGELTSMGATICSLQRATPLQSVVERLLAEAHELSAGASQPLFSCETCGWPGVTSSASFSRTQASSSAC
jgi:ABC-2 type transport system ATP-binding protein